ncbi:MAG: hypothetical protein BWY63_00332 [Chloroflexi bacterium ADurb.Bin360]|nr:MAG: hypothetical protein BWY63_00332 [Chloroflexi bacterium ADurb.Bin360]
MIILGEAQIVSGAKLDFAIDWADVLGARTISSATWATISGLTASGTSISGANTITNVRLTSSTLGVYHPNVTAVLSTAEELLAGFRLQVVTRIVVQDLARAVGAKFTVEALPWSDYLDGDAINSRSWSVGAGLTIASGGTTATPTLHATAAGVWYATEHIITTAGQEDERSIAVAVRAL